MLLQLGLDNEWRADSTECYCHLRNIQDLLSDGETPCEGRFGIPLNGPVILFGAVVEYCHISAKDLSRLHQFGPKVLEHARGIWKGDVLIADIEKLEQTDASETYAKRLNAKEVSTPVSREKSFFTIADRTVTLWRRSASENILLNPGSPRPRRRTRNSARRIRRLTDAEAKNDFWSIKGDFIVAITWNPESNCTCREKNHFLLH